MIEQALFARLTGGAATGPLVLDRVYPTVLPQAVTYPALTYVLVAGESHYAMQGPSRLASARVQLDLYAETHDGVLALKRAVMADLGGFRGAAGSPPVAIHGAFRAYERDDYEEGLDRAGLRVWRKSIDFTVWFKETF